MRGGGGGGDAPAVVALVLVERARGGAVWVVAVEPHGLAVGVEGVEDMRWEVGALVDDHAERGGREPVCGDQRDQRRGRRRGAVGDTPEAGAEDGVGAAAADLRGR